MQEMSRIGSGGDRVGLTESDPDAPWDAAADAFREWRAGSAPAMDRLVRVMTPVLWHVVRAYGLERELAEDVVQTTWLTLVRRAETVLDAQAIGGWLTITARREAWRVAKHAASTVTMDDEVLDVVIDGGSSAEDTAVLNDGRARLWASVATLDERCQRLLRIVAFDARPDYARIAGDLGMRIGSIGPTRGRCLDKLRSAIEAQGGVA
jgi:RNA polymerase sigma factor (sigma-70 family)